jgi:adenylate kinase family enzyme
MQRISIVGTGGSGKTTLARNVAQRLQVPHIELDALNWGPNWTPAPAEVLRERVEAAVSGESWVIEGGYSAVRNLIWRRADTVVWLDYSLPIILSRVTRRTLHRSLSQQELWNGNRESLSRALSRDSMIVWVLKTYHLRRRQFTELLAQPEYAHLHVLRFHSPRQTDRWARQLNEPEASARD